jgi:hypothetical protein
MDERLDDKASEIVEIMEGADREADLVYGGLVRELVRDGEFSSEEVGEILSAVEEKIKGLNEWYAEMNIKRAFPM